jgi:hypothetical protein
MSHECFASGNHTSGGFNLQRMPFKTCERRNMEKGQTGIAINVPPRATTPVEASNCKNTVQVRRNIEKGHTGKSGIASNVSPRATIPVEASICKKCRSRPVKGETWRKDRLELLERPIIQLE